MGMIKTSPDTGSMPLTTTNSYEARSSTPANLGIATPEENLRNRNRQAYPGNQKRLSSLFRKINSALLRKISRGVLLTLADIDEFSVVFNEILSGSLLFMQHTKSRNRKSTALSFSIRLGSPALTFDSGSALEAEAIRILGHDWATKKILESEHYKIFGDVNFVRQTLQQLGLMVDLFYENSVIKLSIDRDDHSELRDKVRIELTDKSQDWLVAVADQIESHTRLESVVVHVQPDHIILMSTSRNDDSIAKVASWLAFQKQADQTHAFDSNKGFEEAKFGETSIVIPSELHGSLNHRGRPVTLRGKTTPTWAALVDAVHFAKPQYFEPSAKQSSQQGMVFPLTTPELFAAAKPTRPRFLVIVLSDQPFQRNDIYSVEVILDEFVRQKTISKRLESLVFARQRLQALKSKQKTFSEVTYPQLLSDFVDFSEWMSHQTIAATMAHSMTVRLYEQDSRELRLVAKARDSEGKYSSSSENFEIRASQFRTSVNAFAFAHAIDGLDFINIPFIDSTRPNASYIPIELRKKGLNSTINARHNTRSEACLPLRFGKVPVGTINLEAPMPRAFDGMESYLKAVRDNIEEAYSHTLGYSDIRSLAKQISTHAAVHELDQHLSVENSIFSSNQQQLLSKLFRLRDQDHGHGHGLPFGDWLSEWVSLAYAALSEENRRKIINLVQVKSLSKERFPNSYWFGFQFIVKNLIQNTVSHGSIEQSDAHSITIDDRPIFGIGDRSIVRITSKHGAIRDQGILDRMCVAPIISNDRGARYGMLLIGMITKTLGGQVFLTREATRNNTECLIKIPYPA